MLVSTEVHHITPKKIVVLIFPANKDLKIHIFFKAAIVP